MKVLKLALTTSLIITSLSVSAFAVTEAVKNVQAQLRGDIEVRVDGKLQEFKTAQGEELEPLSYKGSTYLPLRSIGELMGKEVVWNAQTKVIDLNGTAQVLPEDITDADKIVNKEDNKDKEDNKVDETNKQTVVAIAEEISLLKIDINALTKENSYGKNLEMYNKYEVKMDQLDHKLDLLDDEIEREYKNGKITRVVYSQLERELELAEDSLDSLEDVLEYKLGIDN